MSALPMMKCGHTAQGMSDDEPVCVVCLPSSAAREVAITPNLDGRMARCSYHKGGGEHQPGMPNRGWRATPQPVPSRVGLPFFSYKPDEPEDSYYCGCWGWD